MQASEMRVGQRVNTRYGFGKIIKREAVSGCLRDRFCVKIDNWNKSTFDMTRAAHEEFGYLVFTKKELEDIKKEDSEFRKSLYMIVTGE